MFGLCPYRLDIFLVEWGGGGGEGLTIIISLSLLYVSTHPPQYVFVMDLRGQYLFTFIWQINYFLRIQSRLLNTMNDE